MHIESENKNMKLKFNINDYKSVENGTFTKHSFSHFTPPFSCLFYSHHVMYCVHIFIEEVCWIAAETSVSNICFD